MILANRYSLLWFTYRVLILANRYSLLWFTYRVLGNELSAADQTGVNAQQRDGIISCSTCHSVREPDFSNRTPADLDLFHQNMALSHGKLSCYACHNWNTALLAPRFLASAFVSGPAFIILVMRILRITGGYIAPPAPARTLIQIIRVAMVINLLMLASEIFTLFYTGGAHAASAKYLFLGSHGHYGLVPWIWTAIGFNIVGAFCFSCQRRWNGGQSESPPVCYVSWESGSKKEWGSSFLGSFHQRCTRSLNTRPVSWSGKWPPGFGRSVCWYWRSCWNWSPTSSQENSARNLRDPEDRPAQLENLQATLWCDIG